MEIDISKKVKKTVNLSVAAVLLLTALACGAVWLWQNRTAYIPVRSAQVQGANVSVNLKVGGAVQEIFVEEGETVQAGQQLARLHVKVTPEEIQALEDAVASAKERYQQLLTHPPVQQRTVKVTSSADTAAAQAAYDKAAAEKTRMEQLYAIGGISRVQYEKSQAAFEIAQANLAAASEVRTVTTSVPTSAADNQQMLKVADIQVKQAEMALAASKSKEQAADIIAPVDGIVHLADFEFGGEMEAGQTLFYISSESDSWVEARINAADKDSVSLGEFVQYAIAEYPGEVFKGTVFEIVENADGEEAAPSECKIRISVPTDSEAVFRPGMDVDLQLKR